MKMVMPIIIMIMWVKQCHNLPMTGNGEFIPQKNIVMTGGWFRSLGHCFNHITGDLWICVAIYYDCEI